MSFCNLLTQITLSSFYVLGNRLPVHEKIKMQFSKKTKLLPFMWSGLFCPLQQCLGDMMILPASQFSLSFHTSSPDRCVGFINWGAQTLDEMNSWCVEGLKQQELQPGGAVDAFLPEDTGFKGFVLQSLSPSEPGRIALVLAFLWASSSVQCLTRDHTTCH